MAKSAKLLKKPFEKVKRLRLRRSSMPKRYAVLASTGLTGLAVAFAPGHAEQTSREDIVAVSSMLPGADDELPRFEASGAEDAMDASALPDSIASQAEESAEQAARILASGEASWYGPRFRGRPTANGETFDPTQLTAAHRTLPFGSKVRVTDNRTGKTVIVRINDRGPYAHNRIIDLSEAAARKIGIHGSGRGQVTLALLDS